MTGKNMKSLGIVGSIVGLIVLIFGIIKSGEAEANFSAASFFGPSVGSDIWADSMEDMKIVVIVGAIILVVSIIIAIAGFMSKSDSDEAHQTDSINKEKEKEPSQKLSELQKMLDDKLITQDEYDKKKKEILDNM